MKILVNVEADVQYNNGCYYNNSLATFLKRYKQFCSNLVCLSSIFPTSKPEAKQIDTEGIELVNVSKINSIHNLLRCKSENRAIIKKAIKNVDACIVHQPSTTGVDVIKYAKKYNKPYLVVVVGCAWDSYWNYDFRGKLIAPFRFIAMKKAIADSKYTIYVTQHFLQKRYPSKGKKLGCSNVNITLTAETVLQNRLSRIDELENAKRNIILSTLAAVNVPYKGQAYVIEAIARLKDRGLIFEYHLAGGGDNSRLMKLASKLGVEDQVAFDGLVSHDKISNLLDITDIYIQPSKQEGLPRAMIEAMSRACPALGSRIAGIPELLDSEFLFSKGNVKEISDTLSQFSSEKMREQAVRNYELSKKYDYDLIEKSRVKFISEFIDSISK